MDNNNLHIPSVNVYVILITCKYGIQVSFKADGDIASKLIKRMSRPAFLRGTFKMRTTEGSALLCDLRQAITLDVSKFADMTDNVPVNNAQ